jgi:hypothetical protein
MAGASDISSILSQAGRIEKINQNPLVQSEVARQVLTEDEAKQRIRKGREVSGSDKVQGVADRERGRKGPEQKKKAQQPGQDGENPEEQSLETGKKHIIDVLV